MPRDYNDPAFLHFMKENNETIEKKRFAWFAKNQEKLEQACQFTDRCKGYKEEDVVKATIELSIPSLSQQHKVSAMHRKKPMTLENPVTEIPKKTSPGIVELGLGSPKEDPRLAPSAEFNSVPIMRPVDEASKLVLHKEDPDGRKEYLQLRSKKKPEEKYYFTECSSYDYGWRLNDTELSKEYPKFGKRAAMNDAIYTRTGAQPDPTHYNTYSDYW